MDRAPDSPPLTPASAGPGEGEAHSPHVAFLEVKGVLPGLPSSLRPWGARVLLSQAPMRSSWQGPLCEWTWALCTSSQEGANV